MRAKRLFSALLAAALLASGAQAALVPEGNEYVETRLMAAKSATGAAEYAMLTEKMTGSNPDRAVLANSGFVSETTEKLTVEPGDTFYLAIKFDGSHIPDIYNGLCGANLYYLYDADVFTPDLSKGYVNHITGGTAGIKDEEAPATYLGDYQAAGYNSDFLEVPTGNHFVSLTFVSPSRKYFIPSESVWDFAFPVTVAEDAYSGEYTFQFYTELVNKTCTYGYIVSRQPQGKVDQAGTESLPSSQVKANDVVIEVVNAPARPDTPQPTQPEETDFTDLPEHLWYSAPARAAAKGGLMQGTGKGLFSPLGQLHTAEVVTLCARLHAQYSSSAVPATKAGEAWYQAAYDYCVKEGLFTAEELPLTQLTELATRFKMVELLDRAVPESEKTPIREGVTVPDVAQTDPYGPVVYRWYAAGITQGDGSGSFHGESFITRGETAAILCRLARLTPRIGA